MSPSGAPRRHGREARHLSARSDEGGLASLYETHFKRLRALLVARFSGSHDGLIKEEIEDAIQEAFCRMLEQRSRGVDTPGVKNGPAYLLVAARNLCLDGRRRRSREQSSSYHSVARHALQAAEHELEDHENALALLWLAAHAGALTGRLRSIYSARFVDGLSQVATARHLGLTRRAVRTLERRLLVEVMSSLQANQHLADPAACRDGQPGSPTIGAGAVAPNNTARRTPWRPKTTALASYRATLAQMAAAVASDEEILLAKPSRDER